MQKHVFTMSALHPYAVFKTTKILFLLVFSTERPPKTNKKTHILPISCKNTINQLSSLKLRPLGWINAEATPNEPIFCIISFPWA